MNPSKKFQYYLEETKNWGYRQKLNTRLSELWSDIEFLRSRLEAKNFEQVDYLTYRIEAESRLLNKLVKQKRKQLLCQ